jgi:hypothetical protein
MRQLQPKSVLHVTHTGAEVLGHLMLASFVGMAEIVKQKAHAHRNVAGTESCEASTCPS